MGTLEDELGATLFLRTNKGVELTEAGRCLYQQCQKMFQNLRTMADAAFAILFRYGKYIIQVLFILPCFC